MDELANYGALGILTIVGIKLYWDSLKRQDHRDKEHKADMKQLTTEYQQSVREFTHVMHEAIQSEARQTELMRDVKDMVTKVFDRMK